MNTVLVIAAVGKEVELLGRALGDPVRERLSDITIVTGTVGALPVIVSAAGVGKTNAAAATATLIERYRPGLVINVGCGGAYPGSGLSVGDLAVASVEILGDEGVITPLGWQGLREMGLACFTRRDQRYFNEIPLSHHASEKAVRLADYCGVNLSRGCFVTVSTCSGTLERGLELARRFGASVENMEGAAVALVCLRHEVDCLEIRGISNLVDERNLGCWNIPLAVEAAQRFVLKYLENISKIRDVAEETDCPSPVPGSGEGL